MMKGKYQNRRGMFGSCTALRARLRMGQTEPMFPGGTAEGYKMT
jgi:hypothetical protein